MEQKQLENLVKRASDKMRADDNTKGVAKYREHFSWLLFLKGFEPVADEAEMSPRSTTSPSGGQSTVTIDGPSGRRRS